MCAALTPLELQFPRAVPRLLQRSRQPPHHRHKLAHVNCTVGLQFGEVWVEEGGEGVTVALTLSAALHPSGRKHPPWSTFRDSRGVRAAPR